MPATHPMRMTLPIRLTLPGHLSQRVRDYSSVIRSIIEQAEPEYGVSNEEFWRFLKVIHILPLDFATSTSQQEAWIKQALAMASTDNAMTTAELTWLELLKLAAESAAGARTWKYADLPETMRERHKAIEVPKGKLQNLLDRSEITRQAIRTTIGGKVSLSRSGPETKIVEALAEDKK